MSQLENGERRDGWVLEESELWVNLDLHSGGRALRHLRLDGHDRLQLEILVECSRLRLLHRRHHHLHCVLFGHVRSHRLHLHLRLCNGLHSSK